MVTAALSETARLQWNYSKADRDSVGKLGERLPPIPVGACAAVACPCRSCLLFCSFKIYRAVQSLMQGRHSLCIGRQSKSTKPCL